MSDTKVAIKTLHVNCYYYHFLLKKLLCCSSETNSNIIKNSVIDQDKLTFKKPPKILLVEDDIVALKILEANLMTLGCEIEIATNGQQAITMVANKYDLIFLDIGLPDISGLGVSLAIRSQEQNNHIPVIAITALNKDITNDCLSVGIDEVFIKPISLEQLKAILQRWLVGNKESN